MTESNQVPSQTASGASHAPAVGQQRVVIVGATGMVGGYALRYALDHPAVGTVTAVGRKRLGINLASQAARGSAPRLRRRLRTRGRALG
jgi:N-acetyl-gamma-glutamylphosphate reductase